MTRRGVFMVAGQALGGVAAVGVLLPVVGFAVAPILETPEETWVGVGAPDDFVVDSYRAVTLTIRSGIGEAGKTTAYVRKGSEDLNEDPPRSSRSRPGAHLGCPVRFINPPASSAAPATVAPTTSRAR